MRARADRPRGDRVDGGTLPLEQAGLDARHLAGEGEPVAILPGTNSQCWLTPLSTARFTSDVTGRLGRNAT